MSETLHTVRSTKINVTGVNVHLLAFACMATDHLMDYDGCGNKIERVFNQWEKREEKPQFVVLVSQNLTTKKTAPKEGDMVFKVSSDYEFRAVYSDHAFSDCKRLVPVGYLYKEGRSWKVSATFRDPKKVEAYTAVYNGKEEQINVKEYPSTNDDYVSYTNPEFPLPVVLSK